jgi:DNA polymerase III alpha subunit (gram-positive type)
MYLAFDTETTGLESNCNILTAYFIILDDDLNRIDTLDLKIKHKYYTVYPQALEVNKINLIDHHNDSESLYLELAMIKLSSFLEKNKDNNKYKILGHNVQFDLKMLISNNLINSDCINAYLNIDKVYDSLILAKKLKQLKLIPSKQSLSLSKICYYFELNESLIDSTNFHNAEYDIKLTVLLYKKLLELEDEYV